MISSFSTPNANADYCLQLNFDFFILKKVLPKEDETRLQSVLVSVHNLQNNFHN